MASSPDRNSLVDKQVASPDRQVRTDTFPLPTYPHPDAVFRLKVPNEAVCRFIFVCATQNLNSAGSRAPRFGSAVLRSPPCRVSATSKVCEPLRLADVGRDLHARAKYRHCPRRSFWAQGSGWNEWARHRRNLICQYLKSLRFPATVLSRLLPPDLTSLPRLQNGR